MSLGLRLCLGSSNGMLAGFDGHEDSVLHYLSVVFISLEHEIVIIVTIHIILEPIKYDGIDVSLTPCWQIATVYQDTATTTDTTSERRNLGRLIIHIHGCETVTEIRVEIIRRSIVGAVL